MTMLEDLLSGTQDTLGLGLPQPSGANSGDSGTMTPDGIELRRKLALAMLQSGQEYGPVKSPLEGWNRVLQSMLGTYNLKKLDAEDAKGKREADEALISVFAPGTVKPSGYGAGSVIKPVQPAQPEQPAATSTTERAVKPASYGDTEPAHIDGAGPQLIRAVIGQESGGNPNSVSPTGARGLMQVQPLTGANPGYGVRPLANSSSQENVRFGTDYLNAMLRKYNGDQEAALIAYNGGPARADAWLKAGRNDSVIPRESANYYKQVKARMGAAPADDAAPTKVADASGGNYANDGGGVTPENLPSSRRAEQNSQLQQKAIQLMRSGNRQTAEMGRQLLIKSATTQTNDDAAIQEYEYSVRQGYNKTFPEWQIEQKTASRQQTNVNVSGEKKGAEEMAKLHAKEYESMRTAATKARSDMANLDAMESGLDSVGRTGTFGETEQSLRKAAAYFGLVDAEDAKKVASGDLVNALANKLALSVRTPNADGGGMPGAMSDADREFLKSTVPGLTKTPEGNRQLIGIARKMAQRSIDVHKLAVKYAKAHDGQIDPGFEDELDQYADSHPLFDKASMASVPAAAPVDLDKPVPVKTQRIDPQTGNAMEAAPAVTTLPTTAPASVPAVAGAKQAPDGKWYVPDPNRPGKYLRVEQ